MCSTSIYRVVPGILLVATLAGCSELGYSNHVLRVKLTSQKLVIVPVLINGQGPYSFLLDTGSSVTVVSPKLLSRFQEKAIGSSPFLTGVKTQRANWCQFDSIGLEGAEIGPVEVIGFSLDNHKDLHVDGILGQDILHHYNYLLDYKKKVIVIDEDNTLAASLNSATLPLAETESRLVIEITPKSTKEKRSLFILDSGANCLVVFKQDYEDYGLDVLLRVGTEVQTVAGGSLVRTGEVRLFRIGNQELKDVPVTFIPVTPYTANRPELGTFPLNWFGAVYFNHTQKSVTFDPQFKSLEASHSSVGKVTSE